MLRRNRRRRAAHSTELDITAFLNLMVILVPFLLITAVFSRVTILDLYLPPQSSEQAATKNRFSLEVVIRQSQIQVIEHGSRFKRTIKRTSDDKDLLQLSELLGEIKRRNPKRRDATILAEDAVSYDLLVQVMDRVRLQPESKNAQSGFLELFPDISIGDAPGGRL